MIRRRTALRGVALFAAVLAVAPAAAFAQDADAPVVFAAASLKNALDAVNADWQAATGKRATIAYAASSALAKQIEAGAPADVFFSADRDWMTYLADRNLVKADTATELLGNAIVLVAPADSVVGPVAIAPGFDLKTLLSGGKLAMGAVDSVPAGRYGKAALQSLGVWNAVSGDAAQAENVRAALALVSRGEAPLGIVYATDATADRGVKVVGAFPAATHPAIVYPVAQTAGSKSADARAFLEYLRSEKAKADFEAQGFTVLR